MKNPCSVTYWKFISNQQVASICIYKTRQQVVHIWNEMKWNKYVGTICTYILIEIYISIQYDGLLSHCDVHFTPYICSTHVLWIYMYIFVRLFDFCCLLLQRGFWKLYVVGIEFLVYIYVNISVGSNYTIYTYIQININIINKQ